MLLKWTGSQPTGADSAAVVRGAARADMDGVWADSQNTMQNGIAQTAEAVVILRRRLMQAGIIWGGFLEAELEWYQ